MSEVVVVVGLDNRGQNVSEVGFFKKENER